MAKMKQTHEISKFHAAILEKKTSTLSVPRRPFWECILGRFLGSKYLLKRYLEHVVYPFIYREFPRALQLHLAKVHVILQFLGDDQKKPKTLSQGAEKKTHIFYVSFFYVANNLDGENKKW